MRSRRAAVSRLGASGSRPRAKVRALIGCADVELAGRLVGALAGCAGVEAVGVATTPAEAARKAAALKPDVAVFDIDMGGEMRGVDAGLALRNCGSGPGLVMLSRYDDRHRLKEMPNGMGSEWSCLFTESAMVPGSLARAAQCAAWSIPVVDPKLREMGIGVRPGAPDAGRAARSRGRRPARASDGDAEGWQGSMQTISGSVADGSAALL